VERSPPFPLSNKVFLLFPFFLITLIQLHGVESTTLGHIQWTNGIQSRERQESCPSWVLPFFFFFFFLFFFFFFSFLTSFIFMTCFCNISSFDSAVSCNHHPSFLPLQSLFALTAVPSIHFLHFLGFAK
jgi:hypothetical protein